MGFNMFSTNIIKERKRFLLVFLFNLLALSPLIIFSHVHYSIDTYAIQLTEGAEHINNFLGSYRYFGALVYYLFSLLGLNPTINPLPDTLFYIFVVAFADTILSLYLYNIINQKNIQSLIIIELSVLITSTNAWFTDMLTFPECISLTAVGLLFCFLGIVILAICDRFWKLAVAFILFVAAAATYQQFISLFIIYTVLILCIRLSKLSRKSVKELFLYYLKPFVFIFINSIIYYFVGIVVQRLFNINPNARASLSISTVFDNIMYYLKQQHSFLKGRGFFSTEILTVCYLLIAVIFVISLLFFWKKNHDIKKVIFIAVSFAAAYFGAYLPGLVSTSHGTRTLCALFSVFALFSIGAIALFRNKATNVIIAGILCVVFSLNVYKTVDMEVNQIIKNTIDAQYIDCIIHSIEKYEQKSNNSVNTIGISYDSKADIESDALYVDYAIEPLLQLRANRRFKFIETPEDVIATSYYNKNWDSFDSEEQIVFHNNIVYICVY